MCCVSIVNFILRLAGGTTTIMCFVCYCCHFVKQLPQPLGYAVVGRKISVIYWFDVHNSTLGHLATHIKSEATYADD